MCNLVKEVAKDVDECLFPCDDINYNDDSGKVFKEICVCATPDCQSTSCCHYLKHKKGQTCDLNLCCKNSDDHRKILPEEGLWFPDKSIALNVSIIVYT